VSAFEVDNTPPVIEGLQVGPPSGKMSGGHPASFTARDTSTAIRAVHSTAWTVVSGFSSRRTRPLATRSLNTTTSALPFSGRRGEHTLAVRAYDRFRKTLAARK